MENIKVVHFGSRVTDIWFRKEDGSVIKIRVWISSVCNVSGNLTFFNHVIEVKGFKCRKFQYKYTSKEPKDLRYKEFLTEKQLYEAYHIHWSKLNPLKLFSKGSINGVLQFDDDFKEIKITSLHKEY